MTTRLPARCSTHARRASGRGGSTKRAGSYAFGRAAGSSAPAASERAGTSGQSATNRRASSSSKRALRASPLISIAEVQGDAFGFGFGLAIVCDFVLVAEHAGWDFPRCVWSRAGRHHGLSRRIRSAALRVSPRPVRRAHRPATGAQNRLHLAGQSGRSLSLEADALVERILRLDPVPRGAARNFSRPRSKIPSTRTAGWPSKP